jgi:hypothetical protein
LQGASTKGKKKGKTHLIFLVLVSGVVSTHVVGQRRQSSSSLSSRRWWWLSRLFRHGLVVIGTWQARDVMCDNIVTPGVRGRGMLTHADAAPFDDRHRQLSPPMLLTFSTHELQWVGVVVVRRREGGHVSPQFQVRHQVDIVVPQGPLMPLRSLIP